MVYYFWSPYLEVALAISLVLFILAAPSHFRARNTGTILYICWAFTFNLLVLINKLVWHDHVRNIAPAWCDISNVISTAVNYALGACSIVINRRLYKISRISSVIVTPAQKRRDLIIELSIGLGIPVLGVCMHYVVQGHRGNILQGVGCLPTTYNVTLAFPLYYMWPPLLSFIAIIYGMLSLRAFLKRRVVVEEFLNSNGSGLNADRYLRLMCFSAVELTFAFPLGLFVLLVQAVDKPVYPWISWEDTQSNFDRFDQLPALFFTSTSINTLALGVELWIAPFLSLIFFLFFGLGREQINQYKRWFYTLLKPFGIKPPAPKPYGTDRRTWWQKLLRRPVSSTTTTGNGTGLTSSRGPTDSLPVFRHNVSNTGSYPEKPIPSARSRYPQTASLDASLAFDFDEKLETETDIDINGVKYHSEGTLDVGDVNKALPASPSIVITSLSAHGGGDSDHDDERDMSRTRSMLTTSSASSVAGSSRRVSAAIRDVEPSSEAEARAMEARVQRMA